jgi:hypothetical protein
MYWWLAVSLLVQAQALPAGAAPGPAEQDRILTAMHQYADSYVAGLPNFLCVQTTRQLEADRKAKHWHNGDTLVSKLSFNQGEERRVLQMVNGKPVEAAKKRWRAPLTTEGEFGILLSQVLGKESEANYSWNRWETMAGRQMAVFDFEVDKAHSTLALRLSDLARAVVPYHGSIYADPATGAVWRISDDTSEIPAVLQTREIATTVNYAEIAIGDRKYLLPTQATVSLLLDSRRIRNELEFTDYKKFSADSVITFEPGDASTQQR